MSIKKSIFLSNSPLTHNGPETCFLVKFTRLE